MATPRYGCGTVGCGDTDRRVLSLSTVSPLCQLSLSVHGPEKSLELQARAPGATFVSTVFAGKAVSSLFDGRWHKVVVAVQSRAVSLHVDCGSISSKPLEPRRALTPEGNAFLGLDAVRGTPVRVSPCGAAGVGFGVGAITPHPTAPWCRSSTCSRRTSTATQSWPGTRDAVRSQPAG